MAGFFQDNDGNSSSFRIVWGISALMIALTWAVSSIQNKVLQPWPLDGITTLALFGSSPLKTLTERMNPK